MKKRTAYNRYFLLTVGWAVCLVVSAAASDSMPSRFIVALTFGGLAIAGVAGVSDDRKRLIRAGVLGALWIACIALAVVFEHPGAVAAMAAVGVVFIGVIVQCILSDFLRAPRITADILWGTIGVYLLIATAFSFVFSALEAVRPGSFAGVVEPGSFIYFSFVTMTTLGYGDIVPISPLARLLAAFTAIGGVMYTALVVARLVALEISGRRAE